MISQIEFTHSYAYLLICVAVGLILALILYWRDKKFPNLPGAWIIVFSILRFLTGFIVSALLLNPFIKTINEDIKKPIIVYAQDDSASIPLGEKDQLESFLNSRDAILQSLPEDYDLINLRFGSEVQNSVIDSFNQKSSNLSNLLSFVSDNYGDQNLGALILATDGLYNEGVNPIYLNNTFDAPIYTIALGDSTARKDVLIKNVYHNQIAYLDDQFPIQVDIQSTGITGENLRLTLKEIVDGKAVEIASKNIRINKSDFFTTVEFETTAKKTGTVQYQLSVTNVDGELSRSNNRKNIFVEVLDSRQNFLLLAHAPHPDISHLKQVIESNKNYELDIKYADDTNLNVNLYDFVLFHNLPSREYPISNVLDRIQSTKKPVLYILGSNTDLQNFNLSQNVLEINNPANALNQMQAIFYQGFSNFIVSDASKEFIEKAPPLSGFFGEHKAGPNARPVLQQKIKDIETNETLMALAEESGHRTAVLAAEGFWQWRMYNFLQTGDYELADELISKLIQYLSTKEDKRKFRTILAKNIYKENENIHIDAQLYNDNYESINSPEVSAVISKGSERFDFTFSKQQENYSLDVGRLSPGRYNYEASTVFNGQVLKSNGRFTVQDIELEQFNLVADHGLLQNLSNKSNGELLTVQEMDRLPELMKSNANIKPVAYYTNRTKSVIDFKWLFGLIFLFLAGEWFLRRYFGSY